jgi:hypothetical protein
MATSDYPAKSYRPLTKYFTWKMSDLLSLNYYSAPTTSVCFRSYVHCTHSIHLVLSGLEQSGLAATVAESISLLPDDLRGMFWANIGLIGGNTNFPGFYERL